MPEVSGETKVQITLEAEDIDNLQNFLKYPVGAKMGLSNQRLAVRTESGIAFEDEQEVTLEFDFSDYAPDHDWRD